MILHFSFISESGIFIFQIKVIIDLLKSVFSKVLNIRTVARFLRAGSCCFFIFDQCFPSSSGEYFETHFPCDLSLSLTVGFMFGVKIQFNVAKHM